MFKAIGFVIGLIAIRVLMPDVFHAFESSLVSFFSLTQEVFAIAPNAVTQTGSVGLTNYIPPMAPLPSTLSSY
ncbi:MAG: hypothetical protein FGM57_02970 [Candidatus Taylorbacteria bacterium]|nr:hypothetical protein [Candidatus Taylorbacteria bacterium]